jgi:hypothetical protein
MRCAFRNALRALDTPVALRLLDKKTPEIQEFFILSKKSNNLKATGVSKAKRI